MNVVDSILSKASNWQTLKSVVKLLEPAQAGAVFERLVQLYLLLNPTYSTVLRNVWLRSEVPLKVGSLLKLPATDKGIDLVAETYVGEYWAIQCKYRVNESQRISWTELSTFIGLTYGVCSNFSFGLVCTTTEHITNTLNSNAKIGCCAIDVWRHLDSAFFSQAQSLLKNRQSKRPVPRKPLRHQVSAIRAARAHFIDNKHSRGKLISPCGTGKSLSSFWIAEELESKSILVALPSLSLIRQTLTVWLREITAKKKSVRWLCVCSDDSVAKSIDENIGHIHDLGVPCTTDVNEIGQWLKKRTKSDLSIVFTTYQSGRQLAEAARGCKFTFELGVFDEAHKTVGRRDRTFSHLLFDQNVKIQKRLFMTATERVYSGDSNVIISMDDPEIYGETFTLLTFREALTLSPPILCDYDINVIAVTRAETKALLRKNRFVRIQANSDWSDQTAQQMAKVIALRKAFRGFAKEPINHAITFHKSISQAKEYSESQEAWSTIQKDGLELHCFHVSGKMSTAHRDTMLHRFVQHSPSLITNARCLTEGVDVPNVDCVMFVDPKRSTIDIVQAAGRVMRRAPGKKKGHIIVPIFVDENERDIGNTEAFKEVLCVLRALASNDERIVEFFRDVSDGKQTSDKVVNFMFGEIEADEVDVNKFTRSLQLICWGKLARLSVRPFEEARQFAHELNLRSQKEWYEFARSEFRPKDIPYDPRQYYVGKGWISWGDWLGSGRIHNAYRVFLPFNDAREFVRKLKLQTEKEWRQFTKTDDMPNTIPRDPANAYKKEWKGIADWLGTDFVYYKVKHENYWSFAVAREFVHGLGLASRDEWQEYYRTGRLPAEIPRTPHKYYKDHGWISMGDWLGTFTVAPKLRQRREFHDARKFAHSLRLKSQTEWFAFAKSGNLPKGIPSSPQKTYAKKGWTSWGDWLGTYSIAGKNRRYRAFDAAREFVRKLQLSSRNEWIEYSKSGKRPLDIPSNPNQEYKNHGWCGMGDWLGTDSIAPVDRIFMSYTEAQSLVKSLRIHSESHWREYWKKNKRPASLPYKPDRTYKDAGWVDWGNFLGTGRVYRKERATFEVAREYVLKSGAKNVTEWRRLCQSEGFPSDIPTNPNEVYKSSGWRSWSHFFGKRERGPFLKFREARRFARSLGLRSKTAWAEYSKSDERPGNIPAGPAKYYRDSGWINWADWLGY